MVWRNFASHIGVWFICDVLCLIFYYVRAQPIRRGVGNERVFVHAIKRCDASRTSTPTGPGSSCTVLLDPHWRQIMVCHVSPNHWLFSTFCPHTNAFRYINSKALADSDFFSFLFFLKLPNHPSCHYLSFIYLYLIDRRCILSS